MEPILFDANASLGLLPEVRDAVAAFLGRGLNPSSVHTGGQQARALLEDARERVKALVDAGADFRCVFTSGATEANSFALHYPFLPRAEQAGEASDYRGNVVISAFEHPSVFEAGRQLQSLGVELRVVRPDGNGEICPDAVRALVDENTKLVSVMLANNETGQIFPVRELVRAVRERYPTVLIHTDGVQAAGRLEFRLPDLGVDLFTISAHKLGGLTGVGALFVREGLPSKCQIAGGAQETGWRAGTENVLGAVSFGAAAHVASTNIPERGARLEQYRSELEDELVRAFPDIQIIANQANRIPNTSLIRVPRVPGDDLVVAADLEGVLISSGAACASGKPTPSPVLTALGFEESEAREVVRVSFSPYISRADFDTGRERLLAAITRMRRVGDEAKDLAVNQEPVS